MSVSDLHTALSNIDAAIAGYAAALAADSLAPKASYNVDGEAVSRNEWRLSLSKTIDELTAANTGLQQLINQRQPFIYRQRHRL